MDFIKEAHRIHTHEVKSGKWQMLLCFRQI